KSVIDGEVVAGDAVLDAAADGEALDGRLDGVALGRAAVAHAAVVELVAAAEEEEVVERDLGAAEDQLLRVLRLRGVQGEHDARLLRVDRVDRGADGEGQRERVVLVVEGERAAEVAQPRGDLPAVDPDAVDGAEV